MQEKLRGHIFKFEHVIHTAKWLVLIGDLLKIPIIVTEHQQDKLGSTVSEIDIKNTQLFRKTQCSMLIPALLTAVEASGRKQIVLFGIETHVCIVQTALDLLDRGFDVFIVVDGVSSASPLDRTVALHRMSKAGAILTTANLLVLELLKTSDHPLFKRMMENFKSFQSGLSDEKKLSSL